MSVGAPWKLARSTNLPESIILFKAVSNLCDSDFVKCDTFFLQVEGWYRIRMTRSLGLKSLPVNNEYFPQLNLAVK